MALLLINALILFGFGVSSAEAGTWSSVFTNACIVGNNDWSGSASYGTCKYLCSIYTAHTCLSIEHKNGVCHLSRTKKIYTSAYQTPCNNWNYAERHTHGSWTAHKNACIKGHNCWVGKAINKYACRLRCYQSGDCCSYEYKNGQCMLSSVKQSTVLPSSDYKEPCHLSGWLYSERTDKTCSTGSENYEWKDVPSWFISCISGKNKKSYSSVSSFERCKQLCVQEDAFVCTSIDYKSSTGRCHLSEYTQATAGSAFTTPCSGWWYAERRNEVPWTSTESGCISGNNGWSGNARDLTACKIKCRRHGCFTCASIEWKNGICHLAPFKKTSPLASFSSSCSGWVYSHRNA